MSAGGGSRGFLRGGAEKGRGVALRGLAWLVARRGGGLAALVLAGFRWADGTAVRVSHPWRLRWCWR